LKTDSIPELDIEDSEALLRYLQETARLTAAQPARFTNLQGGISNRTVLVEPANSRAFVLKQALPRLRVATDWPSDPRRIHQEARGLAWLSRLAPPGSIPGLLFEDAQRHLLAMEAVPRPHENWKIRLLSGGLEMKHIEQFGKLLGTIHRSSRERAGELAREFDERSFFQTLRIEPYYRYTASRQPVAAPFLDELIAETAATRLALVHGDYSPKNILICPDKFVLLDHEVIHWGDPAFDIGFSLTHLLSKAHHLPAQRAAFLDAARLYWNTYSQEVGLQNPDLLRDAALPPLRMSLVEARAVRHSLGCLLARVDGRSPLEYLTAAERDSQRAIALRLMEAPPARISDLVDLFGEHLARPIFSS